MKLEETKDIDLRLKEIAEDYDNSNLNSFYCERNENAIDLLIERNDLLLANNQSDDKLIKERELLLNCKKKIKEKGYIALFIYALKNQILGYGIIGIVDKNEYEKNAVKNTTQDVLQIVRNKSDNSVDWGDINFDKEKDIPVVLYNWYKYDNVGEMLRNDYEIKYSSKILSVSSLNLDTQSDINKFHIIFPCVLEYKNESKLFCYGNSEAPFVNIIPIEDNYKDIASKLKERFKENSIQTNNININILKFTETRYGMIDISVAADNGYKKNIERVLHLINDLENNLFGNDFNLKDDNNNSVVVRLLSKYHNFKSDNITISDKRIARVNYFYDNILLNNSDEEQDLYINKILNCKSDDKNRYVASKFNVYDNKILYIDKDLETIIDGIDDYNCNDKKNYYQMLLVSILKNAILIDVNSEIGMALSNFDKINVDNSEFLLNIEKEIGVLKLLNKEVYLNKYMDTATTLEIDNSFNNINLENQLNECISLYKEMCNLKDMATNNKLADTLNTIQIASIVLTILGWFLVVFQGQIYITLIVAFSILSVVLAIIIKNIISKK